MRERREVTTINVTVTGPVTVNVTENNEEIISKLEQIISMQQEEKVTDLATAAEVRELLGQIDQVTTEIADDIADLLNRPEVPDEVKTDAEALLGRLRDVASAYPPVAPPTDGGTGGEPAPEPGSEVLPGLEEGSTEPVNP